MESSSGPWKALESYNRCARSLKTSGPTRRLSQGKIGTTSQTLCPPGENSVRAHLTDRIQRGGGYFGADVAVNDG